MGESVDQWSVGQWEEAGKGGRGELSIVNCQLLIINEEQKEAGDD